MIADAWTNLKDGLPENTDLAKRGKNQLEVLSAYMVNRELWKECTICKGNLKWRALFTNNNQITLVLYNFIYFRN